MNIKKQVDPPMPFDTGQQPQQDQGNVQPTLPGNQPLADTERTSYVNHGEEYVDFSDKE